MRGAWSVVVGAALMATCLVPAGAASAADGGLDAADGASVDYALGPITSRETQYDYGAGRGPSLPIGTDTSRIVIVPPDTAETGALRGDVLCRIYGSHSDSVDDPQNIPLGTGASKTWTEDEWADPAARFIDLAPGNVAVWPNRDADDYDRFDLFCTGSNDGAPIRVTRALWRLSPYEGGDRTITVDPDPSTVFAERTIERYVDHSARPLVASGDRVTVTGPADTWTIDGAGAPRVAITGSFVAGPVQDVVVGTDGTTLAFTVPGLPIAADPGDGGFAVTARTNRVIGGARVDRTIIWTADAALVPGGIGTSSTSLSLSSSRTLSVLRVRADIAVTGSGPGVSYTGVIVVKVDGRAIAGPLQVRSDGTLQVRLPRLSRGTHVVTAEYTQDPRLAASASDPQRLRVYV